VGPERHQLAGDELAFKLEAGPEALLGRLKAAGVYPFSDLDRRSVLERR
jgi:hypothetical protein